MKKSFIMCLLLVMSIFMVSCKKDDPQQQEKLKDTIAPYIEVSFFSEIVIECCDEYNLLEGVKAIDNIERFITERIIVDDGGFDPKKAGTYIITYNVKDSDGNPAEPYVRKIIVVDTKKALLVAHRGGKGVGLENTIEAFVGAYEKGYYAVECDIQETSDGELVVYHDLNISRLTGIDQNVKNCTLEYLQSLTYTKKETDGKIYTGSMLSFKDFIKFIANHNIHAFIELKETSTETTIDKALAIINEQKISEDKYTIIGNSSSVDMLIYLRTISKTMNLQFVAKTDYQLYTESCLLNNIGLDISIDCFSTDKTLAMSTIQKFKDKGLTLNFWVVNKTTDLIKYLGLGANFLNRGVSGDRIVDMYARIKKDLWNLEPDVASFLFGINDLWHEIMFQNGVDIKRFENIYRLIIKETKERLPNTKLILMEPFVLKAIATSEKYDEFLKIKEYANIVKTLAKEFNLPIVLLQDQFEEATKNQPVNLYLTDGIHPNCEGAKLICDEWLKIFNLEIK